MNKESMKQMEIALREVEQRLEDETGQGRQDAERLVLHISAGELESLLDQLTTRSAQDEAAILLPPAFDWAVVPGPSTLQ